jgi:hypothetical protein
MESILAISSFFIAFLHHSVQVHLDLQDHLRTYFQALLILAVAA